MAFWKKKSEDPWDQDPDERRYATVPVQPEPLEEKPLPPWVRPEERPEPIPCPWCGAPMLWGFLYGGGRSAMQWREGPYRGGLDAMRFTGQKIDLGGSGTAWYCTSCRKLTMDIEGVLEKAGPNYTWKDGKVVFPEETEDET